MDARGHSLLSPFKTFFPRNFIILQRTVPFQRGNDINIYKVGRKFLEREEEQDGGSFRDKRLLFVFGIINKPFLFLNDVHSG